MGNNVPHVWKHGLHVLEWLLQLEGRAKYNVSMDTIVFVMFSPIQRMPMSKACNLCAGSSELCVKWACQRLSPA
jgi:hypothetical protein